MTADTPAARPSAPPSDPRETMLARLAALTEVHEFYEFDATTEEQFDTWLHERIKEVRGQLGIVAPAPRSGDGDPPPPVDRLEAALNEYARVLESKGASQEAERARAAIGSALSIAEWVAFIAALASQRAARARAEEERNEAVHDLAAARASLDAIYDVLHPLRTAAGQPEAVSPQENPHVG